MALAAEVSFAQRITPRQVSDETIRTALKQLAVSWKRAKHWITSPDYVRKERPDWLIRLACARPTWALGFADEVWWSRLDQPDQHRWADDDKLARLQELEHTKGDTDPKALACYGLLLRRRPQQADQMLVHGKCAVCGPYFRVSHPMRLRRTHSNENGRIASRALVPRSMLP